MNIRVDVSPGKEFEIADDLMEALSLISTSGPNPLLIGSLDYWTRVEKLYDKYVLESEDE